MNRDTKDTPSTLHSTLMVESGQVTLLTGYAYEESLDS